MDAAQAFGAVSEAYAKYRPTYPPALFTAILDHNPHLQPRERRLVAVDVACGSGQASLPLAALFARVVALDSSRAQLDAARARLARHAASGAHENEQERGRAAAAAARVVFVAADAHATGLPACGADLVTVAQGLHWLDVPLFAREAARLLRPTGSLAAWSYGLARVASVAGGGGGGGAGRRPPTPGGGEREGPPPPPSAGAGAAEAADAAVRRLYDSLAGFWDARRLHVDDGYARLIPLLSGGGEGGGGEGGGGGGGGDERQHQQQQQQHQEQEEGQGALPPPPPPPFFGRVDTRTLEMRAWRGVDELVGYVASWSGVERKREAQRKAAAQRAAAAAAGAHHPRREEEHEEQGGQEREQRQGQDYEDEQEDPVAAFRRELLAALGGAEDASLELVTPIILVLASAPRRQQQ